MGIDSKLSKRRFFYTVIADIHYLKLVYLILITSRNEDVRDRRLPVEEKPD